MLKQAPESVEEEVWQFVLVFGKYEPSLRTGEAKGECAEARSEKDDLKLCLFLLVNVSFSQFVLGLIYPQSTVSLQKKIMMSVWLSC
jgi:hypothetical protein